MPQITVISGAWTLPAEVHVLLDELADSVADGTRKKYILIEKAAIPVRQAKRRRGTPPQRAALSPQGYNYDQG